MKSITEKIYESSEEYNVFEAKSDITKEIPDMTEKTKVPKQFMVKLDGKTNNYLPEYLQKWYGYINMWLSKNAVRIVKICDEKNQNLPEELNLTYPAGLSGTLKLQWSYDRGPIVELIEAELNPDYIAGPEISTSRFYSAVEDFKLFKLIDKIKVDTHEYDKQLADKKNKREEYYKHHDRPDRNYYKTHSRLN